MAVRFRKYAGYRERASLPVARPSQRRRSDNFFLQGSKLLGDDPFYGLGNIVDRLREKAVRQRRCLPDNERDRPRNEEDDGSYNRAGRHNINFQFLIFTFQSMAN